MSNQKRVIIVVITVLLALILAAIVLHTQKVQLHAQAEVMPGDAYIIAPEMPEQTELLAESLASGACQQADVAIIFTDDATAYIGSNNTNSWASEVIQETNRALRNSLVCHRLRLVHVGNNVGPSLGDVRDMADFGTVRWTEWGENGSMRNAVGADYVQIITSPTVSAGGTSIYCGLGYVPNSFNLGFVKYAHSEVSANCDGLTSSHEFGHNFGGLHDSNTSPECVSGPLMPNSCGGFMPSLNTITILSYFQTGYTTRIEYYSNPEVLYMGVPTGQNSTQNNANTIRHALAFFYAMKPETVANDIWVENEQVIVLPQGSIITLFGTLLSPDSSVKTSLGDATVAGNTWHVTSLVQPGLTSIDIQVNEGHVQTVPIDVQVASVAVSGVISGSNGVPLRILPDLGIPTVSTAEGNYQVSVVPGQRTLSAFSFDQATVMYCRNTVSVLVEGNIVKNFEVICSEGSQIFLPVISN